MDDEACIRIGKKEMNSSPHHTHGLTTSQALKCGRCCNSSHTCPSRGVLKAEGIGTMGSMRPGGQPGEMAVFLLNGNRARQVPVTLRARNATHAWITQGLKAGERVVVYPPTALEDGARIKARRS